MSGARSSAQLVARLTAIKSVLAETERSAAVLAATSKVQAEAFVEQLHKATDVTTEDRAALQALALQVGFTDEHLALVLSELSARRAPKKLRVALQCFGKFIQYFTQEDWTKLLCAQTSVDAKKFIVFSRLYKLGLRAPKEHTLKMMASFFAIVSRSDASQMQTSDKRTNMACTTTDWRRYLAQKAAQVATTEPHFYVEILPSDPRGYYDLSKAMYDANYHGQHCPVPCPTHIWRSVLVRAYW